MVSTSLAELLQTVIGAAVFVLFAVGVLAALSAIASKIEDRFENNEITTDIGVDRREFPKRRAA